MRRYRSTWSGAVLGAVLALVFSVGARADELREEFHQTYPLAANGRVALSNINGNVQISAWDRKEVKVDAVKHAGTRERLDEAKIVVNAAPDAVEIKTEYPRHDNTFTSGDRNNPASVDYTLTVPRGARLDRINLVNGNLAVEGTTSDVHADAVNGRVDARGLVGRVNISTVNGQLSASFDRVGSNDIRLHSVNGTLSLTLPSNVEAELRANTVNGRISNDFGLQEQKHGYVGHNLRGTLGNGGAQISLNNVNGTIAVHHASDGKPLSKATSKNGSSQDDDDEDESRI